MFDHVNFWKIRAMQISLVFATAMIFQNLLDPSHRGWLGFSVMMIYAGLDSGTTLHRSFHRFWGAVFGLFLSYCLFFVIRIHYQTIYLVVPIVLFLAYFSLSRFYVTPTIFTVSLTAFGSDYFYSNTKSVDHFFFDYALATTLALCICIVFEKYIFKSSNVSEKVYHDLQKKIIANLESLFLIAVHKPHQRAKYLKGKVVLDKSVIKMDGFLKTLRHDFHIDKKIINSAEDFYQLAESIFFDLNKIYYNQLKFEQSLILKTEKDLKQLSRMTYFNDEGIKTCEPRKT